MIFSGFPDSNNVPKPPIHSSLLQSNIGRQMGTKTYGSDNVVKNTKGEISPHLYIRSSPSHQAAQAPERDKNLKQ